MRRLVFVLCLTPFLLPACERADPATLLAPEDAMPRFAHTAQGGERVAVTGSAHFLTGGEHRTVALTAVRNAHGAVHGQIQIGIHALDAFWHTSVECLTIVGNRAFLGGTVTSSSDSRIRVGTKTYFWVEDHGEGAAAPPDRVSLAGVNETQEGLDDFCGLVQNLLPGQDVLRGNVQIHH